MLNNTRMITVNILRQPYYTRKKKWTSYRLEENELDKYNHIS